MWGRLLPTWLSTSLAFDEQHFPPPVTEFRFLAIPTGEHNGKSESMPKEACEITILSTENQTLAIHIEIDIVKNLEL